MQYGCRGNKVRELQEKLVYLNMLEEENITGTFGTSTVEAIRNFQQDPENHLKVSGIANISTQRRLTELYEAKRDLDPNTWQVVDDDE